MNLSTIRDAIAAFAESQLSANGENPADAGIAVASAIGTAGEEISTALNRLAEAIENHTATTIAESRKI